MPVLATSFMAVAAINFGFLFYLRSVDIPRKVAVDVIPDDFAEYVPTVEKPKVTIDPTALAKKEGEKKVEKKVGKAVAVGRRRKRGPAKPCDADCQAKRTAARKAAISRAAASPLPATSPSPRTSSPRSRAKS